MRAEWWYHELDCRCIKIVYKRGYRCHAMIQRPMTFNSTLNFAASYCCAAVMGTRLHCVWLPVHRLFLRSN